MTDIDPTHEPVRPRQRSYLGTSQSHQDEIDGFPAKTLAERRESERDNAHKVNHDDDFSLPCYEQDDDYADRYPDIPRRLTEGDSQSYPQYKQDSIWG